MGRRAPWPYARGLSLSTVQTLSRSRRRSGVRRRSARRSAGPCARSLVSSVRARPWEEGQAVVLTGRHGTRTAKAGAEREASSMRCGGRWADPYAWPQTMLGLFRRTTARPQGGRRCSRPWTACSIPMSWLCPGGTCASGRRSPARERAKGPVVSPATGPRIGSLRGLARLGRRSSGAGSRHTAIPRWLARVGWWEGRAGLRTHPLRLRGTARPAVATRSVAKVWLRSVPVGRSRSSYASARRG